MPFMFGRPAAFTPKVSPPFMKGGDLLQIISAGLPDIQGVTWTDSLSQSYNSGAFYKYVNHNRGMTNTSGNGGELYFSASNSNPIYGASSTVQPPAICLIPQIKY